MNLNPRHSISPKYSPPISRIVSPVRVGQTTRLPALLAITALLLLLLSSCAIPGVATTSAQLPHVNPPSSTPQALPPIRFPQDEGAHNDLTEWWYYTGHLNTTDSTGKQRAYGFEFVIFQASRSDIPPVYPAHFAITDVTNNGFHYAQRLVNAVATPTRTHTSGINEHAGDWSIQGLNGEDHLHADMPSYAIDLNLTGLKAPTLHNGNGLITYGLGGFSYYYSRTRMSVSGTLIDHNQTLHVTGISWMDHQWGNFLTLGGGGWDWYSLQLKNNTEMMLYFIRDSSGTVISTYVSYIDANDKETIIPQKSLRSTVLGHWTSPVTSITYPSGWHLTIDDPYLKATLIIQPLMKDQELVVYNSTGNVYWEGAVSITGTVNHQSNTGEGYVELTGYAKP